LHTFAAGIFLSEEHPTAEARQISRELWEMQLCFATKQRHGQHKWTDTQEAFQSLN
jgi:hypothetical protein